MMKKFGEMAEWSIALVLKTRSLQGLRSSNLLLSSIYFQHENKSPPEQRLCATSIFNDSEGGQNIRRNLVASRYLERISLFLPIR
jgi:hypothetical protein